MSTVLASIRRRLGGRAAVDQHGRALEDQRKQIVQLERLVSELMTELQGICLLPPVELRMHVGARPSAANFWNQGRQSSRRVMEVFGEDPGGAVLDWGCGSGRTLQWLYALPAWREAYRGCDVDAAAIKWLRKKGFEAVAVCGDEPPLPYGDGLFAALFCFSVLTHIDPRRHRAWLEDIHRVLAPGGRALLTVKGDAEAADPAAIAPEHRRAYEAQGWLWAEHDGHYKSAAIVSRAFFTGLLDGLFEVESYREAGYHRMDEVIVRKTA